MTGVKRRKAWNVSRLSQLGWGIFRIVLIIGLAFIIIEPLIIKVVTSFKSIKDLYDTSVFLIPKYPTLYNYKRVLDYMDYGREFFYSVLYCSLCALLQVASCTLVAYGIARFKFRGRNLIFGMAIFTLVIPPQTVLLSLFMQFKYFSLLSIFTLGLSTAGVNLIGTPVPMLLLSATAVAFKNGLYIFMMRQYFKNVPVSLEEAAYIDGCGPYRCFGKIILPGAKAMVVTIFLFAFVWQWTDYFYTTVLTPGLPVFSAKMASLGGSIAIGDGQILNNMQIMLYDSAGLIVFIVPLIILFLFTQKFFVQSIERSGLVG